jgi:hypothetical protein
VVQELTALLNGIADAKSRWTALVPALGCLPSLDADLRQPLADLAERTALELDDDALLVGSRESLSRFDPDLSLRVARRVRDKSRRDSWLSEMVRHRDTRARYSVQDIVRAVETPDARAKALIDAVAFGRADLATTEAALGEAMELGWSHGLQAPGYVFAERLSRFLPESAGQVAAFVKGHLSPDESVTSLCRLAWGASFWHKDDELADRLRGQAAALVSRTEDPARAVQTLLRGNYARTAPAEALRLFDEFVLPTVTPNSYPLSELCRIDMEAALTRIGDVASRSGHAHDELLRQVIRSAAWDQGLDSLLPWAEKQPTSPLREALVASIANGVVGFVGNHSSWGSGFSAQVQDWVGRLWALAKGIHDPPTKWRVCEALVRLSRQGPTVLLPLGVEEQVAHLFPDVESSFEPFWREHYERTYLGLLPVAEQEERIRRLVEPVMKGHDIRRAAAMTRSSTLPDQQKAVLYCELVARAGTMADPKDRASALSGIALCLSELDLARALDALWEAVRLAQESGLRPSGQNCVVDFLGSVLPPASMGEALDYLRQGIAVDLDHRLEQLWSFARTLPPQEGDSVLDLIGQRLVSLEDPQRAFGVSRLIADPERRSRLLACIVSALRPKLHN